MADTKIKAWGVLFGLGFFVTLVLKALIEDFVGNIDVLVQFGIVTAVTGGLIVVISYKVFQYMTKRDPALQL